MAKSTAKKLENLKTLTEQFKAMRDGDTAEYFTIQKSGECCIDTCELVNTYIKGKQDTLNFTNQQLENIVNTATDKRSNEFESWVSRANSEANKLKKQLIFKIQEAELIKRRLKITACNCE